MAKTSPALSIETEVDHFLQVFQYKHLHKLTLKVPHLSVSVIPCCFVQYVHNFTATPFVFSRKQCLYRDDWFISRALSRGINRNKGECVGQMQYWFPN